MIYGMAADQKSAAMLFLCDKADIILLFFDSADIILITIGSFGNTARQTLARESV